MRSISPRIPRNSEGLDREPKGDGSSRIGSRPTGSRTIPGSGIATTWPAGPRSSSWSSPSAGTREPAFDHARLAESLSKAAGPESQADRLPFNDIAFIDDGQGDRVPGRRRDLEVRPRFLRVLEDRPRPARTRATPPAWSHGPQRRVRGEGQEGGRDRVRSPDGKWTAFLKDHNVFARSEPDGKEVALSDDGKEGLAYARLSWSPDSKALVAFRVEPGEHKEVYLVQSSPPGGGRAKLQTRPYELPGDKFDSFELNLFDVAAGKKIRPELDRIDFGALGSAGGPTAGTSPTRRWTAAISGSGWSRSTRRPASRATSSTRRPTPSSGRPTPRTWRSTRSTGSTRATRSFMSPSGTAGGTST